MRSAANVAIPDRPRRLGSIGAIVGAIALLTAGFFIGRSMTKTVGSTTTESSIANESSKSAHLKQLTSGLGRESEPGISPDGKSFVYSAPVGTADDIFLQRVGGGNPVNLTNSPEDEGYAAFSPDGTQIAFNRTSGNSGVWLMGATGESPRRLTDFGFHPAWDPDGESIVVTTLAVQNPGARSGTGELWRVDVASGQKTKIDVGGVDAVHPSCSPDGKWIAFWGVKAGTSKRVLYVVKAGGGTPNALNDDDFINWSSVWTPDGRAFVFSSDRGGTMNLWRMPIDPATGTKAGPPEPVTTSPTWSIVRTSIDPGTRKLETPVTVLGRTSSISELSPSPDGRSLVVRVADPDEDLVVFPVDDPSRKVRLTNDKARDRSPAWTGDGRVFFFSDRTGAYECWSVLADGSDLRQETRGGCTVPWPSPDGARMLATKPAGDRWGLVDLTAPVEARSIEELPPFQEGVIFAPMWWSPDGTRIFGRCFESDGTPVNVVAYTLATSSNEEIDFPGISDVPQFILGAIPDGNLAFRITFDQGNPAFESVDLRTKAVRVLGTVPPTSGTWLTRDATDLYSIVRDQQADLWMIEPGK